MRKHGSVKNANEPRRGVVLLAVMIVVTILSLAAYQYADLTSAELKATNNAVRAAQAHAAANSGMHYVAAMLATPGYVNDILGGNLVDNPKFKNVMVPGLDGASFTIIAQPDPATGRTDYLNGLVDESGKLNLNAFMLLDYTNGTILYSALMTLPTNLMTTDIAGRIVDYLDNNDDPYPNGGAEMEFYSPLNRRCKNGPLDSLEELLLVDMVTVDLLFGADKNRNGILDPGEDDPNGYGLGLQQYLTVSSREQLVNDQGQVLQNINADLSSASTSGLLLYDMITNTVSEDMAKYIALYRKNGPSASGSIAISGGKVVTSGKKGDLASVPRSSLAMTGGKTTIKSFFELVNTQVSATDPSNPKSMLTYDCPLNSADAQRNLLPLLFTNFTTQNPSKTYNSTNQEIPARVNVNTAPESVLKMLQTLGGTTQLADGDVQKIVTGRPQIGATPDLIYQTPTWLLTDAKISAKYLVPLDNYITTRSQVYRIHVVGTAGNVSARIEAMIDANAGRPRIIYWRDLTETGPANLQQQ